MIDVGIASGNGKRASVTDDNALRVFAVDHFGIQANSFGKVVLGGGTAGLANAVRFTAYNEQAVQAQRALVSTSAADAGNGTGARKVRVTYFDEQLHGPFTTEVVMNGVTPVPTPAVNIRFIEKFEVVDVGTGGANAGVITLTVTAAGAGVIGTIATAAGFNNRTYWAHHYITGATKLTIGAMDAGTTNNVSGEAYIAYVNPVRTGSPEVQVFGSLCVGGGSSTNERSISPSFLIVGPARLTMYFIPSANNSNCFASFDWREEFATPEEKLGLIGGPG